MASGHLPFTLLHLTFHFRFILLFHILNLEPESGSKLDLHRTRTWITYIYTVELLVDTQFEYQLGLAKTLPDSKSKPLSLSSLRPLLHWTIFALSNLHSPQTLLRSPISGLRLKGDIANSFAKAHTLYRPPLMQVTVVYLAHS